MNEVSFDDLMCFLSFFLSCFFSLFSMLYVVVVGFCNDDDTHFG
jgi:hypothetical protein